MARRANLITQTRKTNPNVLLVDAGNSLAFDQDPAKASQGATSVEAMNSMEYAAVALGVQDIALGPAVLQARAGEARYPFLSVNAYDRATSARIAKPFVATEVGGRTVYLLGVTGAVDAGAVEVRDAVTSVREVLAELPTERGIVIVLSNAGAETDQQLATQFPELDVIVAGGGGLVRDPELAEGVAPRLQADLASPGHAGRNVGRAQLTFDPGGKLLARSWERIRLGPEIAEDQAMRAWVDQVRPGQ